MNPSLQRLVALADHVAGPARSDRPLIGFEVYAPDADDPMVSGHYRPDIARERAAFAQAVGKLLAAGYEILTWRHAPPATDGPTPETPP